MRDAKLFQIYGGHLADPALVIAKEIFLPRDARERWGNGTPKGANSYHVEWWKNYHRQGRARW